MKIMILAHGLRSGGGINVGKNFIVHLKEVAPQHQYLITVPKNINYESIDLPLGSDYFIYETRGKISRFHFDCKGILKVIQDFSPSVIFGLGGYGVLNSPVPQALWIQNSYLVYPLKHYPNAPLRSHFHRTMERCFLRKCLSHTQWVFCQTPVMAKRVCDCYHYDIRNTSVLPNAFSALISPSSAGKSPCPLAFNHRKQEDCYGFVLSNFYNHKNPEILIYAMRHMDAAEKKNLKFITTVTENDHPRAKKYLQSIQKYGLQDQIINVGRIPHGQLEAYFTRVDFVIMPTLLESFSATYLEAMHFGVPILTTDIDFARYICGPAAVYYNPWDKNDFINKLLQLVHQPKLRKSLIKKGTEQKDKFSMTWNEIVKKAIDKIEELSLHPIS